MKDPSFDYFDHDADIGIIGRGITIEDAFIAAALATFNIITDTTIVIPRQEIPFEFDESDQELALATWLNLLIATAIEKDLVFCQFDLNKKDNHWSGCARGDTWQASYPRGTEVKGATLTMLRVVHHQQQWQASCVVDV